MALLTWANLIFFVPLGLFLILASLQALGLAFDHDHVPGHDHHGGFDGFLESVGLGGTPLAFIIMPLFFIFGLTGLLYQTLALGFVASLVLALASGLFIAWLIGRAVRRFIPTNKPSASSKKDLLGISGKVHGGELTHTLGEVSVKDSFGNTLYFSARLNAEEKRPLKAGEEVVLLEYDEEQNHYIVSTLK
jgi:membrane protein implicated in regulation of membrane protease activity